MDKANKPIIGASVYINNSTIGTTTDDQGKFTLKVLEGSHNLIISYVGYKTIKFNLLTKSYKKITFRLKEDKNILNEVVVKTKKWKIPKSKRKLYLRIFKRNFIGESKIAKSCIILNENVLEFNYIEKTKTLKVKATKPLKIANPSLGYLIEYDLFNFEFVESGFYSYKGFIRFTKMKGNEKEERKWVINRYKTYLGSEAHFFSSIINERVPQEKFRVDLISRTKNPEYPTFEDIKKAEAILDARNTSRIRFFKIDSSFDNPIDYAEDVIKRSRLDPYIVKEIELDMELHKYGFYDGRNIFLRFSDYLRVIYFDKPDKNYKTTQKDKDIQYSLIKSIKGKDIVLKRPGYAFNPDDVYKEKYWAFKRIGDLLPSNYKAPN